MKISFKRIDWLRVGLLSILFFLGNVLHAQNQKISLQIRNATVKELIKQIESKTSYTVVYRDILVDDKKDITINEENKPLIDILKSALSPKGLKVVFISNTIVITKKNAEPQITTKTKIVSGVVLDEKGQPVIGASVMIPGSSVGVATDINGRFKLEAPSNAKLRISYIGYDAKEELLNTSDDLKIKLEPTPQVLNEIVITAQVRGQIKAINKQMFSNEIMNAVSAERIQELPDANAAETVARLPGVALQRDGGEGSKLIIRGLEPKYSRITIEGVAMASTGGNDRSVDLSMISPYSLDGIEVIKAITADKDADYMGGLVNFKLRKATTGFKSNLIFQGGYNDLRKSYNNYMLVGNLENRFFHEKLGLYLQANIEKKNLSSNDLSTEIGSYDDRDYDKLTTINMAMTDNYRSRNRYGATLVLDYKLPKGSLQFSNILNKSTTVNSAFTENYTPRPRRHTYDAGDSRVNLLTLTNVFEYVQHFGQFDFNAKASHSQSFSETPRATNFHFEHFGALSSEINLNPVAPQDVIQYSTVDYSKALFTGIYKNSSMSKQTQFESEVNLKYNFEIGKNIKVNIKTGFKFRQTTNSYNSDVYSGEMALGSGVEIKNAFLSEYPWMQEISPLGSSQLPYLLFIDNSQQQPFLNGAYTFGKYGDIALMNNVLDIIERKSKTNTGINETYHLDDLQSNTNDYKGNELLTAGYLMSEFKFGDNLTFIPGFRIDNNRAEYTAPRGNSSLPFPNYKYVWESTTKMRSEQFILPMIHLRYAPFKGFNIRLAYTETLSRPNFNLITPRWDIGKTIVSYNNYTLKSELSRNYDVYFSYFRSKLGLLTIGGFVKDISNKIFPMDKRAILNSSDYGLPTFSDVKFIYTQMNNLNISKVRGLEFDWQTAFWYLPGALRGLILNINYTWIYSEAKYPMTSIEYTFDPDTYEEKYTNIDGYYTSSLIRQPKDILNVSLGYDYEKFSARVSMLYTNKVFQGPSFYRQLVNYSDEYVRWDISIKQGLPWYGMQVFCNLNNLSAAKDVLRNGKSGYPTSIQHYGMTVDLGVKFDLEKSKKK